MTGKNQNIEQKTHADIDTMSCQAGTEFSIDDAKLKTGPANALAGKILALPF